MPGVQMRLNPSDSRFFSPDRDLAWCTPHLVLRALQGLDPDKQEPWVLHYLESQGITNEQLCEGASAIATFMNTAVFDPKYENPFDAFKAAGFFELPNPVQTIVLAKIGQVFMSAFFPSIRDVTKGPESPPYKTEDFANFVDAFQKEAARWRAMPQWRRKLSQGVKWLRARVGY